MYKNLYVILVSAYVRQGAPTAVDCHLVNNTDYKLIQVAEDSTLVDKNATVSEVSFGYLIPFSMIPNEIQCSIKNLNGVGSFKCIIQGKICIHI